MRATIRSRAVPSEELTGSSGRLTPALPPAPTLEHALRPRRQRDHTASEPAEANRETARISARLCRHQSSRRTARMRYLRHGVGKTSGPGAWSPMASPPSSGGPWPVDPSSQRAPSVSPPQAVRVELRQSGRECSPAKSLPSARSKGCRHHEDRARHEDLVGVAVRFAATPARSIDVKVSPPRRRCVELARSEPRSLQRRGRCRHRPRHLRGCVPTSAAVSTRHDSSCLSGVAIASVRVQRRRDAHLVSPPSKRCASLVLVRSAGAGHPSSASARRLRGVATSQASTLPSNPSGSRRVSGVATRRASASPSMRPQARQIRVVRPVDLEPLLPACRAAVGERSSPGALSVGRRPGRCAETSLLLALRHEASSRRGRRTASAQLACHHPPPWGARSGVVGLTQFRAAPRHKRRGACRHRERSFGADDVASPYMCNAAITRHGAECLCTVTAPSGRHECDPLAASVCIAEAKQTSAGSRGPIRARSLPCQPKLSGSGR
jgi:hypothetical protein